MRSVCTSLIIASLLAGLIGLALAQTTPEVKTNGPRAERMDEMKAHKGQRDEPI